MKNGIGCLIVLLGLVFVVEGRTWTSKKGTVVEADYLSSKDGIVRLQRQDGKIIKISEKQLIDSDRQWINQKEFEDESWPDEGDAIEEDSEVREAEESVFHNDRFVDTVQEDETTTRSTVKPGVIIGVILFGLGFLMHFAGWVVYVVAGFRVNAGWGIALFFVPGISSLLFTILNWEEGKAPFFIQLCFMRRWVCGYGYMNLRNKPVDKIADELLIIASI